MFATALCTIQRLLPDTDELETISAFTLFFTNETEFASLKSMDAARLPTPEEISEADSAHSPLAEPELKGHEADSNTVSVDSGKTVRSVKAAKNIIKNNDDIVG